MSYLAGRVDVSIWEVGQHPTEEREIGGLPPVQAAPDRIADFLGDGAFLCLLAPALAGRCLEKLIPVVETDVLQRVNLAVTEEEKVLGVILVESDSDAGK